MPNWEYKSLPVEADTTSALEKAGEEGWELVSVSGGAAFLKRERPPAISEPVTVLVEDARVCGNCVNFAKTGSVSKKTGVVPGFCHLNQWSTNSQSGHDCPTYTGKKKEQP